MLHKLPSTVTVLLTDSAASPRLVAHLTLVYNTSLQLTQKIDEYWPTLVYDREAVHLGAATHDVGKIVYKNELNGPGNQHEEVGPGFLQQQGFPEKYIRFARTHARWNQESAILLEDVLVAFADTIWRGERNELLEKELVKQIAQRCHEASWSVYMKLDDIATEIAKDAPERLLWQGNYSV